MNAKQKLLELQKKYELAFKGIEHLKKLDRLQNEGGEGYSSYDDAARKIHDEQYPLIQKAMDDAFLEEWTLEILAERRKLWNEKMNELKGKNKKLTMNELQSIEEKFGFTHQDIIKAKQLHGIK